MNKQGLTKLIREAVVKAIKEEVDMVSEEDLDDATKLLMLISGRIMAANEMVVSSEVIAQAVHHLEQADGILAKAGLKPENSDISDTEPAPLSEAKKPKRGKKVK